MLYLIKFIKDTIMNVNPLVKTQRLELRLAPNQKRALKLKAKALGLTMSEYIILRLDLPQAEQD